MTTANLPLGLTVIERGWLSSNNVLFTSPEGTALVDSSYYTHAEQTLALLRHRLGERPLDMLINTHLHSDHCGGNARLQQAFGQLRTWIPATQAEAIQAWEPYIAEVQDIGQQCVRFGFDATLAPGAEIRLGDASWQVHASPGHDPHSLILFEPATRTLISADALWENGFGVVFQQLDQDDGFDDTAATLDLIESLHPAHVIPGHGRVFATVAESLAAARRRLDSFAQSPERHARHAVKVLMKFRLLEIQQADVAVFLDWATSSRVLLQLQARYFSGIALRDWAQAMLQELCSSGVARQEGGQLYNV